MERGRRRARCWLHALIGLALLPSGAATADPAPVRILSVADPFATVISERLSSFEEIVGTPLVIEFTGYTELAGASCSTPSRRARPTT
ncbi:MAG: hypothetical protein AAF074_01620 [Pseudomonadota bacterium]